MRPKINLSIGKGHGGQIFLTHLRNLKTTQIIRYRKPLTYCPHTKQFYHPIGIVLIHLN